MVLSLCSTTRKWTYRQKRHPGGSGLAEEYQRKISLKKGALVVSQQGGYIKTEKCYSIQFRSDARLFLLLGFLHPTQPWPGRSQAAFLSFRYTWRRRRISQFHTNAEPALQHLPSGQGGPIQPHLAKHFGRQNFKFREFGVNVTNIRHVLSSVWPWLAFGDSVPSSDR